MLVHKLCQQLCPEKTPGVSSLRLGDGADGEVFEMADYPSKVIKFSVLYDTDSVELEKIYKYISKVLSHLILNPSSTYATVYDHVRLGDYSRQVAWGNGKQKYILYYYTMEKLQKISEDERKVFHSILSHEDRGVKKNFSALQIKEMLSGMSQGLDFNMERVIFFCDNFKKTPVVHLDIHVRNIMKDTVGNFKLIDFDRAQLLEK